MLGGARSQAGAASALLVAGFPTDDADASFRPLLVLFECPLIEHPGVTAFSGDRRAQLVAGIGGEASLTLQSLLPAGEGGLQARELVARIRPKTEVPALMKVLIGVDPHKASVALAAVDEHVGELIERASFPQNRAGLRALERSKRNGLASVALSGGERQWSRPAPGEDVGGARRVCGGRPAQAFGPGAGALERQCPQERGARCPGHRLGSLAQRAAGGGRSRGRI